MIKLESELDSVKNKAEQKEKEIVEERQIKEKSKENYEKGVFKVYDAEDFSDKYYMKVDVNLYEQDKKDDSVTGESAIFRIFSKKTDEELNNFSSSYIYFWLKDGKFQVNKGELYDNGPIFYQDFNLDGVEDFAILEGNKSCYYGFSFDVYLVKNGEFVLSKEFSDLAQNYCGMFTMKNNKISTMTKSGCCWHEYSEFVVVNGKPKLTSKITEELIFDNFKITTEKLVNGVWTKEIKEKPVEKD
ncbi:MAG: hypothetical protein KAT32_01290 [Candidatus Moranbacteria bacterium]|nr:hypothetical protein [Candidatus Moranbacteria bacterium]